MNKTILVMCVGILALIAMVSAQTTDFNEGWKEQIAKPRVRGSCDFVQPATAFRAERVFPNVGVFNWKGDCVIPRKSRNKATSVSTEVASSSGPSEPPIVIVPPILPPPVCTTLSQITCVQQARVSVSWFCIALQQFEQQKCGSDSYSFSCGPYVQSSPTRRERSCGWNLNS